MALKRHPALQDYSREHHDELLLVWKIREGLKRKIPNDRISDYILHHFYDFTSVHMKNEENLILKHLPDDDGDKIKILNDHTVIHELVKQLTTQSPDKNKLLISFADELENHIRYEERTVFTRLQNTFSDTIINSMQPAAEKVHECTFWEDKFWE